MTPKDLIDEMTGDPDWYALADHADWDDGRAVVFVDWGKVHVRVADGVWSVSWRWDWGGWAYSEGQASGSADEVRGELRRGLEALGLADGEVNDDG